MASFDRGDIVFLSLEPVVGREMQGERRYALGDVLIAPITQGGDFSRFAGFAVSLMNSGCKTQGVALINKCRMMDLVARKAKKVEKAPQEVIDDALGRLMALFE